MTGDISHTYAAALQNDLVDTGDAEVIGVVRKPLPWLHGLVDRNIRDLGPPPELIDEFKEASRYRKMRGMCDEEAHNSAWNKVDFGQRYVDYLESNADAGDALRDLAELIREGSDVYLVCYENTEEKRCHRTILIDVLRDRLSK